MLRIQSMEDGGSNGTGIFRHICAKIISMKLLPFKAIIHTQNELIIALKTEISTSKERLSKNGNNNLKALAVTLNIAGMVSINRSHEILGAAFGIPISTGTIFSTIKSCAEKLKTVVEQICTEVATTICMALTRNMKPLLPWPESKIQCSPKCPHW